MILRELLGCIPCLVYQLLIVYAHFASFLHTLCPFPSVSNSSLTVRNAASRSCCVGKRNSKPSVNTARPPQYAQNVKFPGSGTGISSLAMPVAALRVSPQDGHLDSGIRPLPI